MKKNRNFVYKLPASSLCLNVHVIEHRRIVANLVERYVLCLAAHETDELIHETIEAPFK